MKISLIENGMDSLSKGYEYYLQYQKYTEDKTIDEIERYFCLKDAILAIHHGIEILFKSILYKESEYLVFSSINKFVRLAFIEKRNKELQSVFQTTLKDKIHTVSYSESIERVEAICGIPLEKSLKNKIFQINDYRNLLIHSEAYIDEGDIRDTLEELIEALDLYFYENFDNSYRTISGYDKLIETYKNFEEQVSKDEFKLLDLKKNVIKTLIESLSNNKVAIGENKVRVITDLDVINNIMTSFTKEGYVYGVDLYNLHSSGRSVLKRISKDLFSIEAQDTNTDYIFKLKSMLFLIPKIDSDVSPIMLLEASPFEISDEQIDSVEKDHIGRDIISEIHVEGECIHHPKEKHKFYEKIEDEYSGYYPEYKKVIKFIDPGIIAFLNIQGLRYPRNIMHNVKDEEMKSVEISLRESVAKLK